MGWRYEVAGGIPHDRILDAMKRSRGLLLLPNNLDPCPRSSIEARLMNRAVVLNDNVQHKDEAWFHDASPKRIEEYVRERPAYFWTTVLQ